MNKKNLLLLAALCVACTSFAAAQSIVLEMYTKVFRKTMKHLSIITLLVICQFVMAQKKPEKSDVTNKQTTIELMESLFDFGIIKQGEKVQHAFKFKNTGNEALIINRVKGSCGCTIPEYSKEPLAPGKIGEINVVFNSAGKVGSQSKFITITANTEPEETRITIKGMVEPPSTEKEIVEPPSNDFAQSIVLETTTPFERVDIGKTPTAPAGAATPPTTSTIWAIVVGIESYKYSKDGCISDLSHAKNDAYEFANYLQYNLGIPPNQIVKLLDNKASEANILKSLETQFSQAGSNDMVLFYFSGHGEERKFIPNDYECQTDGTGFPTVKYPDIETAFDKSRAKHKLLIADACRVEQTNAKSPALLRQQQAQFYEELNKAQAGIAVLMSASKGERSTEAGEGGLFTHYLLKGLNGAADSNKNGIVTVSEIAKYVKTEVVRASDDEQHPEINTGKYDPNMPVGVVGQ